MRPRKWVLFCALSLFLLSGVFLLGKHTIERSRHIENLLIKAVTPSIKGSFTLDAIRIGFLSVYLRNVKVTTPSQAFSVNINAIKVGFSLVKLLQYRGNMAMAINRIILIKPHGTLSLTVTDTANDIQPSGLTTNDSEVPELQFPASALQALIFKDGLLTIVDYHGDTLSAASHLSGVILNNLLETSITASGRLGSSRKNVSLQALFSWTKNKHHVSLRIANANIDKPIVFNKFTITNGMLNGAIECTFTSSFLPDSIETHGWIKLADGSLCIDSIKECIDNVSMNMVVDGTSMQFSAAHATYRGIKLIGEGDIMLQQETKGAISLTAMNVVPDSLSGLLPDSLVKRFPPIDTIRSKITIYNNTIQSLEIHTNRITFGTTPVTTVAAFLRPGKGAIVIDSLQCVTPIGKAFCSGSLPLTSDNSFLDLSFKIESDSLPKEIGIQGTFTAHGTISGTIDQPDAGCIISGSQLVYKDYPITNQQFLVNVSRNHLFFRTVPPENSIDIYLSGTIDSLFSNHPKANATCRISFPPINQFLERNGIGSVFDTASVTATASGWIDDFQTTISLFVRSSRYQGTLITEIRRLPTDSANLFWYLKSNDATLNTTPIPIRGNGTMKHETITISTLDVDRRIHATGALTLPPEKPAIIQANIEYLSVPCTQINRYTGGAFPLDSGIISGYTTLQGTTDSLTSTTQLHLEHICKGAIGPFTTDLHVVTDTSSAVVLPFTLRHAGNIFLTVDTVHITPQRYSLHAAVSNYPLSKLVRHPDHPLVEGMLSGSISTSSNGTPLQFSVALPSFTISGISLDSISCQGAVDSAGLSITSCTFTDNNRCSGKASGSIPWSTLQRNTSLSDTLKGSIALQGDLLASIGHLFSSPVGGNGNGTADISFLSTGGNWTFTRGVISIPKGTLEVTPFVPDKVRNYTGLFTIDSSGHVHTAMSGTIKKRPISIISTHTLPDGYEPLTIGPLDFGGFQVVTPQKGVDLHLPGFMALKEIGTIDFKSKAPFSAFTISGPLDKLKLTGTWLLRDLEFTFPFLPNKETSWSSDPFPYITWEMDVMPGNRNVVYFWDLTGKKNRIMRFLEGYLDLSSAVRLRGRDMDKSFRILGSIRSYKGAVYYGRVFDRNFDVGVEFNPQKPDKNASYDNLPLLWGSAETFADTSRYNRVKLTCMVNDPVTGAASEKGRLVDGPTPNISFHVSSDFEELPGEGERDFYRQAGLTFATIDGAGGAVSDFGEQMFHRYLLQRWERKIAKKLGLDVINIESSIVSNYFSKLYDRQFDGLLTSGDYLALANVGVTVGRYFFRDNFFLKARGELIPVAMMLTPEYSFGFEFQPSRYLLMDINYGFHKTETSIQHSPLLMLQLRLPISGLRKNLNF